MCERADCLNASDRGDQAAVGQDRHDPPDEPSGHVAPDCVRSALPGRVSGGFLSRTNRLGHDRALRRQSTPRRDRLLLRRRALLGPDAVRQRCPRGRRLAPVTPPGDVVVSVRGNARRSARREVVRREARGRGGGTHRRWYPGSTCRPRARSTRHPRFAASLPSRGHGGLGPRGRCRLCAADVRASTNSTSTHPRFDCATRTSQGTWPGRRNSLGSVWVSNCAERPSNGLNTTSPLPRSRRASAGGAVTSPMLRPMHSLQL